MNLLILSRFNLGTVEISENIDGLLNFLWIPFGSVICILNLHRFQNYSVEISANHT